MTATENKSTDRRARRTRRQLKEALFALILEKGYDAVTIEDITGRADLGRTTFYLHYKDKEDLLVESIDSIAADLIARLPPPAWNVIDPPGDPSRVIDAIPITFEHAAENAQLYRVILRGEGAVQANRRIHAIIRQKAVELVNERMKEGRLRPHVPMDVFANYFAGTLLATITWWLETDMPYPPDEMAEMFRMMFFQGGRKVLGIE
ncbi:MAG: TetR/AcrR family transcriptional regulator [Chloroflexi bacterium]|nr:MAG: TetR/AcrR family transcriptional regulator [Chloroflexota bacterium]